MDSIVIYTHELLHTTERMSQKNKEFVEIILIDKASDGSKTIRPFVRFIGFNMDDKLPFCLGDLIDVNQRTTMDKPVMHDGEFEETVFAVRVKDLSYMAKEASREHLECIELYFIDEQDDDGETIPASVSISAYNLNGDVEYGVGNIDCIKTLDDLEDSKRK